MLPVLICLWAVQVLPASSGEPPRTGLMWLRSPLPAVFPLQVKTAPGHDYRLLLVDAQSQSPTLAAYIEGGAFFRVLVPPGQFRLRFAFGESWQGEDTLFGSDTRFFELEHPLLFETRGVGTKAGHLVDLRNLPRSDKAIRSGPFELCQTVRLLPDEHPELPLVLPPYAEREEEYFTQFRRYPRYEIYTRVCE